MSSYRPFFFTLVTVVLLSGSVSAQKWLREIVPLDTTVPEMKKIITGVFEDRFSSLFIRMPEGNLLIDYSQGNCVGGNYGSWDVPSQTITHVTFYPKKKRKLSHYSAANISSLTTTYDSGHRVYSDEVLNTSYSVQYGKVTAVRMYPKDDDKRRCGKSATRLD